jgi:putative ABC transport system substrate-binding protein
MKRRDFLALVSAAGATFAGRGWAVAAPGLAQPAPASANKRLGFIFTLTADDVGTRPYLEALRKGLASQGRVEGKNLVIDYRFYATTIADGRKNAQELIALKPDVLVSVGPNNAIALTDATKTIPVVFAQVTDVVGSQIMGNLAHPPGNATGFFNRDESTVTGKLMELLKELSPGVRRAGLLYGSNSASAPGYRSAFETAAGRLGVEPVSLDYSTFSDIPGAVADFAKQPETGVVIPSGNSVFDVRQQLYLVAASNHLPVVWGHILFAIDGAPVVYTIDSLKNMQGGGEYAGRVLNGEKIADLPAQLPLMYSLIINLKGARAQGLTIPPTLLIRADQVIQ